MTRARALFVLAIVSAACRTSPAVDRYAPAMRPQGIEGIVVTQRGDRHRVELLALTDSAYVVMTKRRVAVAPYRLVRRANFDQFGTAASEYAPPDAKREQLRLVSRFPQGIPPTALAALLAEAGQQGPDYLPSIRP